MRQPPRKRETAAAARLRRQMAKPKKPEPFGPGQSRRPAVVAWMPAQFGSYAQSYRIAGEGLIKQVHKEQLEDFYVYPIGYIYRHALELALKHANYLVEDALAARARYRPVPKDERLTHNQVDQQMAKLPSHRLTPLLARLEGRLALIEDAEPIPEDAKAVIEAVDDFDVDGQRWRFPYLTKGRGPSFQPRADRKQLFIDLEGVHDTIDPVLGLLLDGLDGWLSQYIEVTNEIVADFGPLN
jgi:hypothetical protein